MQGIVVTDSAACEIAKLAGKREKAPKGLRVGIRGGGCTGFSYLFEWADGDPRPEDHVFEKDGIKVFIDPKSMKFLDGMTLDFVTSMMGHGFKFQNPNVKSTCGCGESVQF
jgi:iron-sulfur cluster assembly protein